MPPLRALVATPYRIGVLVLLVVTVAWRAWTVSRWTWHVDDWLYIDGTRDLPLIEYLFQDYNGHLMPGGFLVTWVVTALAPLDFRLPVVLVALASGALVVLWALALRRLVGESTWLLAPLALLCLSPLLLRPTMWWASALQTIPLQIFLATAVLVAARTARAPRSGDKWQLALVLIGALFFWQKSLLLVSPLAALLVFLPDGPLLRRVRDAVGQLWPTLVVAAAYVPFFLWRTSGESANSVEIETSQVTLGAASEFFARGTSEILGPGLLGGPWGTLPTDADPFLHQSVAVSFVFGVGLLMGALYVLTRVREGWVLLGAALAYVVAAWGVILFSSRFELSGQANSTVERFHADSFAVVVVLMTTALATHLATKTTVARRRRWTEGVGVALVVGSLVLANSWQASRVGTSPAKPWVSALTQDVDRLGDVALWDGAAPDAVLPAFWLEHAQLSNMVAVLPSVTFGEPAPQFHAVLESGRLAPVTIAPNSRSEPGPVADCGYSVEPGSTVAIPMDNRLFDWTWGLQLDTLSAEGGELTVRSGATTITMDVRPGLEQLQAPFAGIVGTEVQVSMSNTGGTVCVAGLTVGNAVTGPPVVAP